MHALKVAVALALFLAPAFAGPLLLVLPNAETSTLANDSSGSLALPLPTLDVQDIWVANQFNSVAGSLLITQIAFRLKPGTGSISATTTSFSGDMSTTSFSPTTMSTTFATNRGADYTQVLSGTGTLWSSPGCTALVTCPFDIVLTLSTPFLYNPLNGNLLTELHAIGYNGVGTGQFDVENFFTASGSPIGELVNLTTGSPTGNLEFSDSVTQVGFTLVTPEPASYALALCGLGAVAALRRRWRS